MQSGLYRQFRNDHMTGPSREIESETECGRRGLLCGQEPGALVRSQERLEQSGRDVPDDGNADPVSANVVGVVVSFRKPVVVAEPHEPRRLSGRQQPRANRLAFDNENGLPRGAARRRAQAAGSVIEANLGPLSLSSVLVSRSPIDRSHSSSTARHRFGDLLAMQRRHQFQEMFCLGCAVPSDARGRVFDKVREHRASRGGRGDPPPSTSFSSPSGSFQRTL